MAIIIYPTDNIVHLIKHEEKLLTVMMEGRGAPVKCSMTSQLDFLMGGVCGVFGVLGVCGCEDGVEGLEPDVLNSNSTRGLPPSWLLLTCCLRLAHLLVVLGAPVIVLCPISPWRNERKCGHLTSRTWLPIRRQLVTKFRELYLWLHYILFYLKIDERGILNLFLS